MTLALARRVRPLAAAVALAVAGAAPALGHDFVRDAAPVRWVDQAMTEDLPPLKFPAYFNDFDKAKAQVNAGRYKTALLTLRKIKEPKPDQLVTIALCKGRALFVTGRTEDAVRTLQETTKVPYEAGEVALATHPRVQLLRAEVLAETGRAADALAALHEHLAAYPDSWGGHYWAGEVCERLGDTDGAKAHYAFFTDAPREIWGKWLAKAKLPEFDDAEKVTWMGRGVDRWATLNQKYRNNTALPRQILNAFVRAQEIDVAFWPARVAAGEYFMERDDKRQAMGEFAAALKANPQDVRTLRLVGQLSLAQFDFARCEAAIAALRKFDPGSITADLLEGRNLLHQRVPLDAESPIQRVLSLQPRNLEALGLLAATYALQLREDKADQILKQVDEVDVGHDNAGAYLEVAEQLGAMRQYPRAAAKYKVAIERAPWWTAAWNGLGLLYTQSGDEVEAHATINAARELDPFNLETTNYQRLLSDMAGYKRIETPHFVLIYDAAQDPILGEYLPEYLESIHAAVSGEYKTEPPVKTFIEVFPTHAAFSVRTTGSPWIGTVGASTGRVITLVSPRKGGNTMGTFNWAQVLRHEYTHTVTLAATDNRIQHWMTEGLAVLEERTPIRWQWVPMLYGAVTKKELFTLDNLTWGFVRPKKPTDRSLAYAESWWLCRYVQETYGHEAILKMLALFKDAGRMEDVFPAVTGKPMPEFYKDFLAWCDGQVAGWGYDEASTKKYEQMRDQAEAAAKVGDSRKAITLWEKILFVRPVDALPHTRLAGLYIVTKQYDKAVPHLEALHLVEESDNRYAKQIAVVAKRAGDWKTVAKYARQAVYVDPYDLRPHELLKEACEQTADKAGVEREDRVIPVLKAWMADQERQKNQRPTEDPKPADKSGQGDKNEGESGDAGERKAG
ncbi:MAG: hypothetical protein JWO31_3054 [Phycisphaerales bacterium]|nr:hypothetical protein [Phycisphaerales bacterium]